MLAAKAELGMVIEVSVKAISNAIRFMIGSYLFAGELYGYKKIVISIIAAGVISSYRDGTTRFAAINIINYW